MKPPTDNQTEKSKGKPFLPLAYILIIISLLVLIVFTIKSMATRADAPVHMVVYAYSTMDEVMQQAIFPEFKEKWETEYGAEISIDGIFGPSETIAGQINLGAPADVVLLSNVHHLNWLKAGKLIAPDSQPQILAQTPMVIVTRPGNPFGIRTFADLSKPGIHLLHPDPATSGAGQWAVLAEYGSVLLELGNPEAAREQLISIWENVNILSSSARSTLTLFEMGAGDALVTYEQDARLAQDRGLDLEIVIPGNTIIAQPVVARVGRNIKHSEAEAVEAFIDFLFSDNGQEILVSYGFRPLQAQDESFPPLAQTFLVSDLGGWAGASKTILEEIWRAEIEPMLEQNPPLRLENGKVDG